MTNNISSVTRAEELEASLCGLALRGALPHTIIIEGADVSVRREIMRAAARALVCTDSGKSRAGKPCGECESCKMFGSAAFADGGDLDFAHPDIKVFEKLAKSGKPVSVDDVRSVKSDAYIAPVAAECKIYIALNAEKLNVQSQNALLKLLEEPPNNVYFIFSCPSAKMMLETVRSRASVYSAGSLSEAEAEKYVRALFPKSGDDFILRTARLYRSCDGFAIENASAQSLEAAYSATDVFFTGGIPELLFSSRKSADPKDLQLTFEVMTVAARDALLYAVCKKEGVPFDSGRAVVLSDDTLRKASLTVSAASSLCSVFSDAALRLLESANPNAVLASVAAAL